MLYLASPRALMAGQLYFLKEFVSNIDPFGSFVAFSAQRRRISTSQSSVGGSSCCIKVRSCKCGRQVQHLELVEVRFIIGSDKWSHCRDYSGIDVSSLVENGSACARIVLVGEQEVRVAFEEMVNITIKWQVNRSDVGEFEAT